MVYSIQMELAFRNTARRDGVQSNIIAKCAGLPQYGALTCTPGFLRGSTDPALYVTASFINQADRDDLWVNLNTYLGTGVNGPVTGSRASVHDCQHDENQGACVVGQGRSW